MHLQPIVETAVVETGVVETGVAETGVAETAVAETAVAETIATAVAETAVVDTAEKEATPDCPMQEALPNMKPPAPAAAIDLCIGDDAVHVDEATAVADTAVADTAVATPSVDSKKSCNSVGSGARDPTAQGFRLQRFHLVGLGL